MHNWHWIPLMIFQQIKNNGNLSQCLRKMGWSMTSAVIWKAGFSHQKRNWGFSPDVLAFIDMHFFAHGFLASSKWQKGYGIWVLLLITFESKLQSAGNYTVYLTNKSCHFELARNPYSKLQAIRLIIGSRKDTCALGFKWQKRYANRMLSLITFVNMPLLQMDFSQARNDKKGMGFGCCCL